MRETRPRNVKEMLVEAKNTSELMVDLSYAAIFYNSEDLSEEVSHLEERLNDLVFDMRTLAILAARSPSDAEQMAGILQVVQDIEKIGNAAVDIAKIVVKRLGIPPELLEDIPEAEEIPSRVRVHADSALDGRSLGDVDLPVETGMRPIAIRSEDDWDFDPEPDDVLRAGDVLFLQGPPEGVAEVRELAGARPLGDAPEPEPPPGELSEIDRAVDILIEMKNLSEVAVGLVLGPALRRRGARPRGGRHRGCDGRDALPAGALGPARSPPRRGLLAPQGPSSPRHRLGDHRRLRHGDGLDRRERRGGPSCALRGHRRIGRDRPEAHRLPGLSGRRQDAGLPQDRDRDRYVRPRREPGRALDLQAPRHLQAAGRRLAARYGRP